MAAKTYSGKKPENMKKTVGYFLSYMGRHKRMLFVVAVLVSVSALYKAELVTIHGIEVEFSEGIVKVALPLLMPHRKDF